MGAIHLQSGVFPQALQREVEALEQETDGELQAIGLRSLAARLERQQPELSVQIYDILAESPVAPEAERELARTRLAALQGQGSGGARWEALIGCFSEQATDYRSIVPMMLASSVAGLVKVAALGGLFSSAASIFSRGLGARLGANGLAFAVEVPVFSLSGRALHSMSGAPASASLGQDLAASALSLACLKGFAGLGSKLSRNPILHNALFAPAGLYTAHSLEERLGWRPVSDSASRAVDAIAASFSLSVGARLGGQVLGENFARQQAALQWRGELAASRPLQMSEWRLPGLPQPLMMAVGEGGGGGATGTGANPEPYGKREALDRDLKQYRNLFGFTLMGDLLRNIESRLASSSDPLRVLDIGPAEAGVVGELRQRFGDRLALETRDHDFLEADLEGRRYDLIFALLGGGSQPPGQLMAALQKAVNHLDQGGELVAAITSERLRGTEGLPWRKAGDLAVIRSGLEQGLALRFEKVRASHLLYARRLEPWREIPLQDILTQSSGDPLSPETQAYLEKGLRDQPMQAAGHQWKLDQPSAARIAQTLAELGARNALIVFPSLPQLLMDRFVLAFHKDHHRLPAAHEIQNWIDGREPSALHSRELLVDEWLRLHSERAQEVQKRSNPLPGLMGVGIGLATFFGSSKSWALDPSHGATHDLSSYALPAVAGLIVLTGLLLRGASRLQARQQSKLPSFREPQKSLPDESSALAWTRNAEAKDDEEITLPGGPKVLGRRAKNGLLALGAGALSSLSPNLAEASESAAKGGGNDWALGLGIAGLTLLGAYGLGRWISELRKQRHSVFLGPVPLEWALLPPENEQNHSARDNVHYFPSMPGHPDVDVEVLDSHSGARWFRVGEPLRPGWVKEERKRIFSVLSKPTLQEWERELAMNNLVTRLVRTLRKDTEVGEAAKLMWDLSVSPKSGTAGQRWLKAAYSAFINSPIFFDVDSPTVYREGLRLRRIFSDAEAPLPRRVDAVRAYADLFRKFDLERHLARAETRMALDALTDFLDECRLERGSRPFMTVNGAWIDIDSKLFLWRSGKKNGLKAGNEDWEGNY